MAYIDDERRRRAGVGLTRDREAWLAAAMEAQAKGLPIPPLPTEMAGVRNPGEGNERPTANQGQRVLSPAYTDPRSQAIAQTPAIIRPVHSMLDRLFRPGRADTANQMNREYKENALTGQVAGRSARADMALKELELRARKGDDDALKGLKKYYEVEALRRGGGGNDIPAWMGMAKRDKTADGLVPTRKAGAGGGDDPSTPSKNPYMNMTRAEAIDAYTEAINRLNKDDLEAQAITEKSGEGLSRGGWKASDLYEAGIPMENLGITPGMKQKAEQRLERNKQVKDALTKQISAAHDWSPTNAGGRPLTSPPASEPTVYNPDR